MEGLSLALIGIVLVLLALLKYCGIVVKHDEEIIIETFGQFSGVRKPGFVWIYPFIQTTKYINWRFRNAEPKSLESLYSFRIPTRGLRYDPIPLKCTSMDNFTVGVNVVVGLRVEDTKKAAYESANAFGDVEDNIETHLYEIVRNMKLMDITPSSISSKINLTFFEAIKKKFGVQIYNVRIQSITAPKEMIDSTVAIATKALKDRAELDRQRDEIALRQAMSQAEEQEAVRKFNIQLKQAEQNHEVIMKQEATRLEKERLNLQLEREKCELSAKYPALIQLKLEQSRIETAKFLAQAGGNRLIILPSESFGIGLGNLPVVQAILSATEK